MDTQSLSHAALEIDATFYGNKQVKYRWQDEDMHSFILCFDNKKSDDS